MPLPVDFQFSQNNLQDYLDCARRFELRALRHLAWPAAQSEPVIEQERAIQRGSRFHHMLHQAAIGLPPETITNQCDDAFLATWWQNYLTHPPQNLPQQRYPEFTLHAPFAGFRLIAKFDLIAIEPGQRAVIVDWKTAPRRSARSTLAGKMQTKLYRFLLVEAGASLNQGLAIQPEQVQMLYWFANEPTAPEIFSYSPAEHKQIAAELHQLIQEIQLLSNTDQPFPLTTNEKHCAFCTYRSLCGRGIRAGNWEEMEEEPEEEIPLTIDLEQIGEIAF
jgi:hypothetical protein